MVSDHSTKRKKELKDSKTESKRAQHGSSSFSGFVFEYRDPALLRGDRSI
jgi:hypothetical protein